MQTGNGGEGRDRLLRPDFMRCFPGRFPDPDVYKRQKVFLAFSLEVLSTMVFFVIRTWAAVWLYSEKIFWYTIMSLAWPTAA